MVPKKLENLESVCFHPKKRKRSVCLYWTALPKFYIEAQSFCKLTHAYFRWPDFKTESEAQRLYSTGITYILLNYLSC